MPKTSSKKIMKRSKNSNKATKRVSRPKKVSKKVSKKVRRNKLPTIKLCDTCLKVKVVDGNLMSRNNESWKTFPHHLPILGRKSGSQTANINLGKKNANCLVYYFGAKTSSSILQGKYPDSYKDSTNNGLVKLDNKGKACIKLDCPMPYKDSNFTKTGKQTYMSHIHMLVSNSSMTKWNDKLYTQNVLCEITKKQLKHTLNNSNRLVINALSSEYHEKNSIPKSCNLYYKDAKKMSNSEIKKKIMNMLNTNTEVASFMIKHKLKLHELPIAVYCYSKTCDAGHQLALELFRAGFTNVVDYPGGIIEWMNR